MSALAFGVDWYPEQTPRQRWALDVTRMRETGFNLVRLAEFAWSRLEPEPGRFEWRWLDDALALLAEASIDVMLGTPTAAGPPWLVAAHPDLGLVDAEGRRRTFGSRRDACPAHPAYREAGRQVASAMAARYGSHPAVVAWQIDNEFGDRSFSPHAARAFREWLRARHGSLDALNEAWGTVFWSGELGAWDQVQPPLRTTHAPHNPGLELDWRRFQSDLYADLQREQVEAIRAHAGPHQRITHNLMGFAQGTLDYEVLSRELDFVGWDNYPSAFWRAPAVSPPHRIALGHAAMWGLKRAPFWVIEQQAGASGWREVSPPPRPGQVALWAWQAVAEGADGVVFFRWDTARRGAEQLWHGILGHDGEPNARLAEVARLGAELRAAAPWLAGTTPTPVAAVLSDYPSRFSCEVMPEAPGFSYEAQAEACFAALVSERLATGVLTAGADWSGVRLLVAPSLRCVDEALAARLEGFVAEGGTLVLLPRAGTRDASNAFHASRPPGPLAPWAGFAVEGFDLLPEPVPARLDWSDGASAAVHLRGWRDLFAPGPAEALCHADGGALALRHRHGRGQVVALALADGPEVLAGVVARLAAELDLPRVTDGLGPVPPAVAVAERRRPGLRVVVASNHGADPVGLRTSLRVVPDGPAALPPYGTLVLVEETP